MEKWILFLKSQKQMADAHTHRGKISLGQRDREVPRVLMCCRPLCSGSHWGVLQPQENS